MTAQQVHLYSAGGALRHVLTSDAPIPPGPRLEEVDSAGNVIALDRHELDLDDGAGRLPRFVRAAELLEALELDGSRAPRFKPDAPAELRGLRLRSRLPVDPDRPGTPPPELMTLAAAPAPSLWRRVRSWWA